MYCCTECFSVEEIKEFIKGNDEVGDCDYCGSEKVNVADASDVGQFIKDGVNRAYEDPANQVGYCSAEGGYNIEPDNLYEILVWKEGIFSDKIDDPTKFIDESVPDETMHYVQRDPYGPSRGDSDAIYHWEKFCKIVKTNRRYTAFWPEVEPDYDLFQPSEFMKSLVSDLANTHFNLLDQGTKIYRARILKSDKKYKHEDLTSPPPRIASNNRMSPAGISLFYGALEPETCISELRPSVGEDIVVGEFEANETLIVLDLSGKTQEAISIFSEDYSYNYERWISFVRDFVADISRPIRPMDQEIDYVPTQAFTEFLRLWDFKDLMYYTENKLLNISGMQFNSSLRDGGKNVVLFRGPEISLSPKHTGSLVPPKKVDPWLSFKGSQTYEVSEVVVKAEEKDDGVVS